MFVMILKEQITEYFFASESLSLESNLLAWISEVNLVLFMVNYSNTFVLSQNVKNIIYIPKK